MHLIKTHGLELELTLRPPLGGVDFMVSESALYASKGGKQPTALPSCDAYESQQ